MIHVRRAHVNARGLAAMKAKGHSGCLPKGPLAVLSIGSLGAKGLLSDLVEHRTADAFDALLDPILHTLTSARVSSASCELIEFVR